MHVGATVVFVAALGLATASVPAAATDLYVFGDSLVDAGNVSIATGGAIPNPAQGYYQGRFNNGLNYVDYLNQRFSGGNTTPSLAGGRNFAFGGARAIGPAYGGVPVPGLPQQLGTYLAATGGVADPNGLYVVNFGGNDVFGIATNTIGGLTPTQAVNLLVSNTVTAVQRLSAAGAGKILVTGIPVGGPGQTIDNALQAALTAAEPALAAKLYRYSYLGFYTRFGADPTAYNFPAVVTYSPSCIAARPVVNGHIDCTGFFSFDGTHFTAQVQRGIARDIVQVLGVPEPALWVQLIAGFGVVGAVMRRQALVAALSAPHFSNRRTAHCCSFIAHKGVDSATIRPYPATLAGSAATG